MLAPHNVRVMKFTNLNRLISQTVDSKPPIASLEYGRTVFESSPRRHPILNRPESDDNICEFSFHHTVDARTRNRGISDTQGSGWWRSKLSNPDRQG